MNTFAKLAIAAAAVLVVALVGYNLLPSGSTNVGGPPATASPSPTAAASPSVSASPSAAVVVPPAGPLPAGRHTISQNGIEFSLEFPAGWTSSGLEIPPDGVFFTRGDQETLAWMQSWSIDGVYADPCGHVAAEPVSPSAADLAAAVAGLPGVEVVTPPTDVTLGGRQAKHVAIRIPDDIGCAPNQFLLWYDDVQCGTEAPCSRWATSLRETNRVWIFEVAGKHVWIEYETYEDTSPQIRQELQQIVDSIEFL